MTAIDLAGDPGNAGNPDPLAGTDLATAPLPDGLVGLGLAEVFFLMSLHDTPTTALSREFLLLDPKFGRDDIVLCGASSLVARGMLTMDGERLVARSSAALFEVITGQTVRWTRVGLIGPDTEPRAAFFLQTPVVSGVVQPDAMATWWTRFGDADDDTGAILEALVRSRLELDPGAGAIIDTMGADQVHHNVLVRTEGGELMARAETEFGGVGGTRIEMPADGLAGIFRNLVPATA